MRLIDADALMKEFAEFVKESNNSDFADIPTWNDAVSLLGSAPTVKAISVEWIEEWYKTHVYYLKEEKPIIYAYEQMIMDWEKENEKDN